MGEHAHCAEATGWKSCSSEVESCNTSQIGKMNTYTSDFIADWSHASTADRPSNGAFIYSCHTHTSELSSHDFGAIRVGDVTMQQAIGHWWNSPVTEPAEQHRYVDCKYKETTPHRCNPTCSSGLDTKL